MVSLHKFDVFGVSETWLNANISNDQLIISGYNSPLRNDRVGYRGGGVAMYIANHLPYARRCKYEHAGIELLWVEITLNKSKVLCGVCYRPILIFLKPTNFFVYCNVIWTKLEVIIIQLLFLWVINAHSDNSSTGTFDAGAKLSHFIACNNLSQLIKEPTRITQTRSSILDLIITDFPSLFVSNGTLSPPSNCDHNVVVGEMSIPIYRPKCFKRIVRNYVNVDQHQLNSVLASANWESTFSSITENIDEIYKRWLSLFLNVVECFIPSKVITICPNDKPWMSGTIHRAMRKRNRLLKKFSNLKTSLNWQKYREQRNLVVNLVRNAKKDHNKKINCLLSNPSTSVKKWWNIIKSYYGIKAGISVSPLQEGDSYIFDPKEKADVFNDYFISQTYLPANRVQLPTLAQQTNSGLSNISVIEDEVFILLNQLDVSKACGADGVSNRMLKLCMNGLGKPLTKLINTSFVLGQFPSAWKLANVLPLYKTENANLKTIIILFHFFLV